MYGEVVRGQSMLFVVYRYLEFFEEFGEVIKGIRLRIGNDEICIFKNYF